MALQLAVPFRIERGRAVTVDQDTLEAVAANVGVLFDTFRGERLMAAEFGVEDPTFLSVPEAIDEDELEALAAIWEPRALVEFYDKTAIGGEVSVVCVVSLREMGEEV